MLFFNVPLVSIAPLRRIATAMKHRQDDNRVVPYDVEYPIGETPDECSADIAFHLG